MLNWGTDQFQENNMHPWHELSPLSSQAWNSIIPYENFGWWRGKGEGIPALLWVQLHPTILGRLKTF